MAYIEVIDYDQSEGDLREIYDELIKKRGKLADIHKIQSLNPESIIRHIDLYMNLMFGKSPLSRIQREMIAVIVSVANKCEYCHQHHGAALNKYWKDESRIEKLKYGFPSADLNKIDVQLCNFAMQLTLKAGDADSMGMVSDLKKEGLSDRAILDATLVISYFNFVNRLVLGLGVELENDKGEGYEY